MVSKTAQSERRKKSRMRPPRLVYVELPSGNGGMMRDLSEEGFAVRTVLPLRAGEKISFSFSLEEWLRVDGEGEVLWIEENGRVAGIQFAGISRNAFAQIREWLKAPAKASRGTVEELRKDASEAPTLEQLREELLATPPREELEKVVPDVPIEPEPTAPTMEKTEPQPRGELTPKIEPEPEPEPEVEIEPQQKTEIRPTAEEIEPSSPPPEEERPASLEAFLSGPHLGTPEEESDSGSPAIEELLPLPQALKMAESPADVFRLVPSSRDEAPMEAAEPPSSLATPESEPEVHEPTHQQPDISEILIQPLGRATGLSAGEARLEPLSPWEMVPQPAPRSWTDWFTLSRAILIMVMLTWVVAFTVYRRELGQGLIWLGEKMGGTREVPGQTAQVPNGVNSVTPAGNSASPPNPAPQPSSEANRPANESEASANASGAGKSTQGSESSVEKNAHPPVTPLSGMGTSSTEANPGNGQEEYGQAMKILRAKNSAGDLAEAVRLLWASVEKGNSEAEVALADLYWHGRGVAKNCDQTRILLRAAARQGSAEAQRHLQQFEQIGCK